ncbi:MAG: hypothetical protein KGJ95_10575, partial [Candidatus Omnitrophica bacterium]|nr:hypothetical protein [Candidatus Omnitrophota bacterium]
INLRQRALVLDRIKLSSRRNTTEPLLLGSIKILNQWLDVPLTNVPFKEFESELEKVGFWGVRVNREIKNGIAKVLLWLLDKVNRDNIGDKEQDYVLKCL